MPRLFLFRHAPTNSNAGGRFMGHMDVPCSDEGILAARCAHKALSILPDVILCSPLLRAVTTAKELFPSQPIQTLSCLIERDLGEWSSVPKDEVREAYPGAFLASGKMDPLFCPPRGESWDDFHKRGQGFLDYLGGYPNDATVVAVTHNGIIRLLRHLVSQLPVDQIFAADEHFLQPIELPLNNYKNPLSRRTG